MGSERRLREAAKLVPEKVANSFTAGGAHGTALDGGGTGTAMGAGIGGAMEAERTEWPKCICLTVGVDRAWVTGS